MPLKVLMNCCVERMFSRDVACLADIVRGVGGVPGRAGSRVAIGGLCSTVATARGTRL